MRHEEHVSAHDMTVSIRRGAGYRLAGYVAGRVALCAVGVGTLEDAFATAILRAPNAGRTPRLAPGERGIAVGPPDALLSVAITGAVTPRGTVFVLHGVRDTKESLLTWCRWLEAIGYRVVAVDSRGHGRSTGTTLTYGVQESRDLSRVLDTLVAEHLALGPVGVMGFSYGAATAIQWAAREPRVSAAIAVAPFCGLREVVDAYAGPRLPHAFVARALARAGVIAGFDPDEASPAATIARTRAPVLLVHGRNDTLIPHWHSERIRAARPERTELVVVDGEGHESVAAAAQTRLAERTSAWFRENLR